MTDAEIAKIARLMGAQVVAELPDVLHGASGAGHLARFYQLRMAALRRQDQERAAAGVAAPAPPRVDDVPTPEALRALTKEQLAAARLEAEKAVEHSLTALAKVLEAEMAVERFTTALANAGQSPEAPA